MERLLLAVDGSAHADRAATLAGHLSAGLGAVTDVLHVIADRSVDLSGGVAYYGDLEQVYGARREAEREAGIRIADEAAKLVVAAGGAVGTVDVAIGNPAVAIVETADASDADAIVMGRRGRGDVAGLFMGSVSHKVAHLTGRTLITTE